MQAGILRPLFPPRKWYPPIPGLIGLREKVASNGNSLAFLVGWDREKIIMKPIFPAIAAFGLVAHAIFAAPVKVVSFSPVLTEIAEAVGGANVDVVGIVKPGTDPHDYSPTPGDFREVADAQLVLVSGNGMERYLDKLRADTAGSTRLLEMGTLLPTLEMEEDHHHEDGHHHEHSSAADPHWWHSVPNVVQAVEIVRDALVAIDPSQKSTFDANAAVKIRQLEALQKWIKQRVAEIPRDRRQLVTSHEAFQYFAKEYGFQVEAVEGINREQQASAKEVSELIETIRAKHVKAIFIEDTLNPKVTSEITRETGVKIGGALVADGLGKGDTSSYEGMMRHNVDTIVESLK